ncbi:hypothetical protein [Saccharicrinis fermentans]|uniref:Uncharacterized protein n=1 Tax=Saccharicrinis fermentans DSM 9555 = JCM 21142 TaxID=869213 RepID=W7YI91_9BACT|nr:hypothetical protein [Saccharicrinis fermentans]GAF02279.1 hypothetical protein JCM21142_3908 [Saccharicrinis fermentans DSM 9555 = JCM 21142]
MSSEKICGFFNCSSIHHITSFNNYAPQKAYLTLKRQAELLCEEGVLVIRDFVKPDNEDIFIHFPNNKQGHFDAELLEQFARDARSLSTVEERGFPLKKIEENNEPSYQLSFPDAVEFIRRKDYLKDWKIELQEEYGYFNQEEFENVMASLGMRTIVSQPIYNAWIINNRYKGKFKLTNAQGEVISTPPTNYVIAAEKVINKGTLLKAARQLPVQNNSFLELHSYVHEETHAIFDLANRPGSVIDLLPYYIDKENIKIIAKHNYPRPIINTLSRILDNKRYSGYIIEGITGSTNKHITADHIKDILTERTGIKKDKVQQLSKELQFYTSPGGINECVVSYSIEISSTPQTLKSLGSFSGFKESGKIIEYDALQLLKSAQVGALPEARLELGLYRLLNKLNKPLGKWLNEEIQIQKTQELVVSNIDTITQVTKQPYKKSDRTAHFLVHKRAKFYEYQQEDSEAILEYIEPQHLSSNTIVTLPVFSFNNKIYLGIEKRELPVPQLKEGNSTILTAPAYRLPKEITNLYEMKRYISAKKMFNCKIESMQKLGEKYIPCAGASPEQVYPYVITLDSPSKELHWISMESLLNHSTKLRDGHLLICLFRLKHFVENHASMQ